jgi:hypothetical protein
MTAADRQHVERGACMKVLLQGSSHVKQSQLLVSFAMVACHRT